MVTLSLQCKCVERTQPNNTNTNILTTLCKKIFYTVFVVVRRKYLCSFDVENIFGCLGQRNFILEKFVYFLHFYLKNNRILRIQFPII